MNEKFVRARYPHMRASESEVWRAFLQQTELELTAVTYDLHLGIGIPPIPGESPGITRLKEAVTRKRVDAVAETAEDIWIMEIKERIGLSTLGQLLTYFDLYTQEYPQEKAVMLGAIGWRIEPDIQETFEMHAVNIFLVRGSPSP